MFKDENHRRSSYCYCISALFLLFINWNKQAGRLFSIASLQFPVTLHSTFSTTFIYIFGIIQSSRTVPVVKTQKLFPSPVNFILSFPTFFILLLEARISRLVKSFLSQFDRPRSRGIFTRLPHRFNSLPSYLCILYPPPH